MRSGVPCSRSSSRPSVLPLQAKEGGKAASGQGSAIGRGVFWIVAALVVIALAFPYALPLFY